MPAGKSGGHFFLFRRPRRAGARGQTGSRPKAQLNGFSQRAPGSKGVLAAAARHGCPRRAGARGQTGSRPEAQLNGFSQRAPGSKGVLAAAARHGCPPLRTAAKLEAGRKHRCTDFRSEPRAVRVCPLPPPVTAVRPCGPRPNWKQAGSTGARIFAASPGQ